jgi:hypothetical protein
MRDKMHFKDDNLPVCYANFEQEYDPGHKQFSVASVFRGKITIYFLQFQSKALLMSVDAP